MKAVGKNVVVSLELGVPGVQVSDPSSISMVSTKVASKDAVVVVPSTLNPVNHTTIKVVPQVSSSTTMHVSEEGWEMGGELVFRPLNAEFRRL
ncbi:hypothetical protein V6N11_060349 [Hibiscus sabdariffa]|uniref:Uncharacterized protein n=1 Tax=Hibiscus sabdariffa TaxID=183260 RepID=A0ABR2QQ26_9ROSI